MHLVWMHVHVRQFESRWSPVRRRLGWVNWKTGLVVASTLGFGAFFVGPLHAHLPLSANPASPSLVQLANLLSRVQPAGSVPPAVVDLPGGPAAASAAVPAPTSSVAHQASSATSSARSAAPLPPSVLAQSVARMNRYSQDIAAASQNTGVPIPLLRAIILAESEGYPNAVSPTGAEGLMQLEPTTAQQLGIKDPFDPTANTEGGAEYLRMLLTEYGGRRCVTDPLSCPNSLELALAAYNAGPAVVHAYGGIPPYPTTERYVNTVMELYQRGE